MLDEDGKWNLDAPDMRAAYPAYKATQVGTWANPQGYFTPGAFKQAADNTRLAFITALFVPIMWRAGNNWVRRGASNAQGIAQALYVGLRWKVWTWTFFQVSILSIIWAWYAVNQMTPGAIHPSGSIDRFPTLAQNQSYVANYTENPSWTLLYLALNLAAFVPAVAVTYCQCVDESLFKHRLPYRLFAPFHKRLGSANWVVLHSMAILPFIAVIIHAS